MLTLDLSVPAGDTASWTGTILGPSGSPQDLTGLTVTATISTPSPITKTLTVISAAAGTVRLTLARADTLAVPAGAYAYDVVLTDVTSGRTTAAKGNLYVVAHANP